MTWIFAPIGEDEEKEREKKSPWWPFVVRYWKTNKGVPGTTIELIPGQEKHRRREPFPGVFVDTNSDLEVIAVHLHAVKKKV